MPPPHAVFAALQKNGSGPLTIPDTFVRHAEKLVGAYTTLSRAALFRLLYGDRPHHRVRLATTSLASTGVPS
jgi:hypothetical protein